MKNARIFLIASSLILFSIPVLGQVVTGAYPFGPFTGGPDTLNLGNLNASWTIPIVNKAGRGQNFVYNLNYDSSVYYPVTSGSTTSWQPVANWGWQGLSTAGFVYAIYTVVPASGSGTCGPSRIPFTWYSMAYSNLTYFDQNGVSHYFTNAGGTYLFSSASGQTGCPTTGANPPGTLSTPAADGSGLIANFATSSSGFSATFTLKNGTTITAPLFTTGSGPTGSYYAEDTNGNYVSSAAGTYTDTLGTTALAVVGSAPSNTTLSFPNPSGGSSIYTVSYTSYNIKTAFNCNGITEYSAAGVSLVNQITLPDGRYYQIEYEQTPGTSGYVTGRPASVTLPTGGTIAYTYTGGIGTPVSGESINGIVCADGSASGLTRTTPDGTSTYTRALNTASPPQWTTTVTAPSYGGAQNQTVSTFLTNESSGTLTRASFYEIERQVYAGSVSPGNLLETIYTCYETNPSYCSSAGEDTGTVVSALTNIRGATLWPGGLTSGYIGIYDSFGSNTSNAIYDYNSSNPFSTLLQTTTTTTGGPGDQPIEIKVTDGGANVVADTQFAYSSAVTATSGTPNHLSGYNVGNLSSVKKLVTGTTYLTSSYTYYDTGNVNTATDVNGEVTTYTYGSGTSCGNSFPTQVSSTTGGAVATLTTSASWYCAGGVQNTSTDVNNNMTTYGYGSDLYWRPVTVTNNATTAVTSYTYPTTSSNYSSVSMNFNGSTAASTSTSVTTYDGLGRPIVQQTEQAPGTLSTANFDTIATAYDALGRVAKQTLPYQGTLGQNVPTNPGTTTTYDPLNRITAVTDSEPAPGPGTKTYTYTQNDVLVTVGPLTTLPLPSTENLKMRNLEYNGAGWLTSVCEVTSALPGHGTCGQTSAQNGYLTKYGYDGAGRLKLVQQNYQSGSPQTRSISYDDLGRKLSETIPEWSGTGGMNGSTTTYTYDSDTTTCGTTSKGDLIKMVDNMTNTTCYTYDLLHRPTSSQQKLTTSPYYSNTPLTYAVYDAATMPSLAGGAAMTNVKGTVAEAYTCSTSACSTKQTDIFFSATPVTTGNMTGGVQSQVWEATPHSGGYFNTQETFYPNGAVGAISGSLTGDSAGSATNLIPDSSQVGNSSWWQYCAASQNGAGLTVDTTAVQAPDGSYTAAQYNMPSSYTCGSGAGWGGIAVLPGGLTTGDTYTVSVWLRGAHGGEAVQLGLNDCGGTGVTLTTSWQRYVETYASISSTVVNCPTGPRGFQFVDGTPNSQIYVWGPQTEQAASASPYVATENGPASNIVPTIAYGADGEGRPVTATDSTDGLNLVTATGYNNASLPTSITYGNAGNPSGSSNDVDSFTYDSYTYRPTTLKYSINPASGAYNVTTVLTWNPNASLQKMAYTDGSPSPLSQTCTYSADDLSRIASVNCGSSTWAQTFSYDAFGNITKTGSNGGTSYAAAYSSVTNQVSSNITPTPTYDGNGNQKTTTSASLTWNALNQPISVNSTTATYDALGRMVETSSGSTWKQFVFQPDGSLLAVFNDTTGLVKGTIPLPGGSSAIYDASGLSYIRHKDWLGSSRLATTWNHTVYSKEAYAPFGETYNESGTPDRSFTGQDQDVVTGSLGSGVYDYLFRKYDPSAGRWLSPDPYGWNAVRLRHPQSLNRYAYVQNNPLSMVDPTGLDCTGVSVGDDANDGCDGSNGGNDGTGCDNPSGCVTVTDNEPADPDCSDGSCDSFDWSGGFFPWGDGGNGSNGGIISPSSGGGGGGKPCLVGAGPLQVGQSRCPPKMPPGSNLLSTDCNSAIGAISATYSVSGAPGGAASTSWNGLFPGGQCQPRGPGFNCYSAPIGNGCTVTYCPPYNLQFQQAAPALYVPKGTNLPQMSSQCTTIIP